MMTCPNMPSRLKSTKFLFVLPNFAGGGAERVTITLLNGMAEAGYDVHLVTFALEGPRLVELSAKVQFHCLGTSRLRHSIVGLIRHARALKPDIIFSSLGYVNLALVMCKAFLPKKSKIILREANLPSLSLPNTRYPAIFKLGYQYLLPKAHCLIVTSTRMREEFQAYGFSQDKIFLLNNPVNVDVLRANASGAPALSGDLTQFVAVGRLVYQKGFDRLLEWLQDLNFEWQLTILGEGPDRASLEHLAKSFNIEDKVNLRGYVETPEAIVASADALLMPSRWEGMPNAALEALALGTPVIATAESGGIQDIQNHAPQSVHVAQTKHDFLKFCETCHQEAVARKRTVNSEAFPRKSLLPPQWNRSFVVQNFEDLALGTLLE